MTATKNPHSTPRTGRRSELHGLRELATQLYALLSSGQHGLAYAVGRGGPALILRETDDDDREGASPQRDGSIGGESPGPDKVGGRSIRVLRFVGDVPKWERAKELVGGVERDRKFSPWTLLKHLIGDYAVAPMAGGWVQWVALDIDAHPRNGESELDARRRAKRVLGAVWRALNCSATRHPLVLRSPGGGYHVWLPLTRGPASANAEHTWPAQMVQRCVAWHLTQAGLELGPGNLEVFPSGVGLRAPCGRGMVLLGATQPDDPDALGLVPWPGTATAQVDWGDDELAPRWSRRIVPTVRAFIEQWEAQRRTLADWLSRPEFEWERQWGCLGWREGHNDIPRWREIFCGEKNSAQNTQGGNRSQQSDDEIHRARGGLPAGGEAKGEAGSSTKGRSGSSIQRNSSSPSAQGVNLSPDSAGGKLVRGREFREKYTTLLLEGVTQPSTRFDAVHTLVFYWGATCGRPQDEVLERLKDWCHKHPHPGARNHNKPRVFVGECLREARSYLKRKAPGWRFRGGGHAGGLVSLTPADRVITAAVDPRVALEVGAILAWLKGHADGNGRVLDPVQISHGLLRRLCGDRRVDIDGDGRRHRVATLVLTELERLGVLTLSSNYRVGKRGRVWCCWYQFGSGELPRVVALPAAKWDQIKPFTTEPLVPAPALLQVAASEPQETTSAPVVEVRVLGERVVPEGLLSVLSDCARGLPRALLTCAPGVDRPTAAPAPRPPWFERAYRCLQLTPRWLWRADAAMVSPDASELRVLPRRLRLDLGGGGRDAAARVPNSSSSNVTGIAPIAEVSVPSSPIAAAAALAVGATEPIAGGTLLKLVIPQPARSGAAASGATASTVAPASSAGPESEAPEPCAPARTSASSRQVVDARAGAGSGVASVARAGPGDVAAGERPESALRAELADNTGAAFTAACDVDILETLCQTWNSFLGRGRGS